MDTLRKAVIGLVVVLVGFAATGCAARSGYIGAPPFEGELGEVVAGNLALTCPGDYFVGPPINGCLRHLTNIGPRFAGYPMYVGGRSGRQLSRTEKIALVGVASAAACGVLSRDWRVAAGCAAAGAVTTAVVTRGRNDQQVRHASDGTPIAVGRPVGRTSGYEPVGDSAQSGPKWVLRNMTGGKGELMDGDRFIKILEPGETFDGSNPDVGYRLVILVPTAQGTLQTREAVRQPRRDGWDLVAPSVR